MRLDQRASVTRIGEGETEMHKVTLALTAVLACGIHTSRAVAEWSWLGVARSSTNSELLSVQSDVQLADDQKSPFPETIKHMSDQLNSLNLVMSETLGTMNLASENAAPKIKEKDLWNTEAMKLAQHVQDLAKAEADNNAAMVPLNEKVRQWNGDCAGHPLTNSEVSVCNDRLGLLSRQKAPLDQRRDEINAEAKDSMKRMQSMKERWTELDTEVTALHSSYDMAYTKFSDAKSEMNKLKAIMHSRCDLKPTPEDMVECGEIDWDGAKHHIPLSPDEPAPFAKMR